MSTWLIVVLIWIGVDVFLAPVVSAWMRRGWEYELHARLHSRTMEASPRRVQNPRRNPWPASSGLLGFPEVGRLQFVFGYAAAPPAENTLRTRQDARQRLIYPQMLRPGGLPRAS
jgi:hypothetical protein